MKQAQKRVAAGMAAIVGVFALAIGGGYLGSQLAGRSNDGGSGLQIGRDNAGTTLAFGSAEERKATPAVLESGNTPLPGANDVTLSFQQRFRDVAAATLPVVVEVNVVSRVQQPVISTPFDFFQMPRDEENGGEPREFFQEGVGSGVIVARDGDTVYVLTNDHVAGRADEIEVVLHDGRSFGGELVGSDSLMDLAMVSFETTEEVPLATLGNSENLAVGDWVFAVGNPLGYESTVTAGIVSAIGRDAGATSNLSGVTDYIQTDAAINRGNSGGPLVNLDGEVVGINTWIASGTGGSIGLGFAIPVNNAQRAVEDFIAEGSVEYSWLGVQIGNVGEDMADVLGLDSTNGAIISSIWNNSPGARSGLLPGDVILEINGASIDSSSELVRRVATLEVGEPADFLIMRNGAEMMLDVRTGRRAPEAGENAEELWPGFIVRPLTDQVRSRLDLGRSVRGPVVVDVVPGSTAAEAGLRAGDVVTEVNGTSIADVAEFFAELNEANGDTRFRILRNGRQLILGFGR